MVSNSKKAINKSLLEEQKEFQKLKNELKEVTALAEKRLNQIKCLQADFENYKKLIEKEKKDFVEFTNENLIRDLLVIIDDFKIALQSVENEKDKDGLLLLYRKFFKMLEAYGLKEIDSLNKKFNSYLHEAVLKEKSDKEDGSILEEIQKGYMIRSKVIRPTKVKIAYNKSKNG